MTEKEIETKLMELLGKDGSFSWHREHRYNKRFGWWGVSHQIQATVPVGKCECCDNNRTEFISGTGHKSWEKAWEYFINQYKALSEKSICPT